MSTLRFPIASAAEVRTALREALHGQRRTLVLAALVLTAASAAGLVTPTALGRVVDLVDHAGSTAELWLLVLLMAAGTVLAAALLAWGTVLAVRVVETALARLREQLVDRLLRLPTSVVEDAGAGDAVSRATDDVAEVSTAVNEVLPTVASAAFLIGATFVGLGALDWRFALALACILPIQLFAVRSYLASAPTVYARERAAMAERAEVVLSTLRGLDTVRALRLEPRQRARTALHSWAVVTWSMRERILNNIFWGRLNAAEFVGMSALLCVGFWLVREGQGTVGMTTAALLLFHRLFGPIGQLLLVVDVWQSAAASLRRIVGVLQVPAQSGGGRTIPVRDGQLALRGVSFSFEAAGRPTLEEVSLDIEPGRTLAVVGPSGAGKSTLAGVVAGLRSPHEGTVLLDGHDLAELDPEDRSRVVGLITQETHIFAGTLRTNLTLAREDADEARLWAALERVGAARWVRELPDGLDQVVGLAGVTLTPLQRQHLALARIDLLDPAVALLDEATAEAGSAGAAILDEAAEAVIRGRTSLVIAHRLDQAARADTVALVADGRVVELGSHDQLLTRGGQYAELWQAWSLGRQPDGPSG
ncbi:MAG: ABC transporter ATP-binding protein [Actinomycetales bacterium]|mgnify:CR=1 FL=1|nr:ABC transporter ATP-binding protein [Actinomycetales bacterium]